MPINARTWYPRLFIVAALAAFSGLMVLFLWQGATEQHSATQAAGALRKAAVYTSKEVMLDVHTTGIKTEQDPWADAVAAELATLLNQKGFHVVTRETENTSVIVIQLTLSRGNDFFELEVGPASKMRGPGERNDVIVSDNVIGLYNGQNKITARAEQIPDGTTEEELVSALSGPLATQIAKTITESRQRL